MCIRDRDRILSSRRERRLRYEDLLRLGAAMRKAAPFVTAEGWRPTRRPEVPLPAPRQLELF